MPNGGSDCCGTCWFNRANHGEYGSSNHDRSIASYCEIRELAIEIPFYTYCANHPYRTGQRRQPVPVGPVYVHQSTPPEKTETGWIDHGGTREVWRPSPDSEIIRQYLIGMLENPPTGDGYPFYSAHPQYVAVWQMVEFKDKRVVDALERLAERDDMADSRTDILELLDAVREKLAE